MKENFQVVLYFILFLVCPIQLVAQEVIISGKVVDSKANPIDGVSVIIKGTDKGTLTNVNGKFSIKIDSAKKNMIVFSSTGYIQQEVSIQPVAITPYFLTQQATLTQQTDMLLLV